MKGEPLRLSGAQKGEYQAGNVPGPRRMVESPAPKVVSKTPAAGVAETAKERTGNTTPGPQVTSLPPSASPARLSAVTVEPIPGFKTRAEYLRFRASRFPEALAVVTLPLDYDSRTDKRYPLAIAFGGAGECARTPRDGALAWMCHYKADEAVATLEDNRLDKADFRGLVTEERLRRFNASLQRRSYQGVILVCPYSPLITVGGRVDLPEYETFVMDELLPELTRRYRVRDRSIGVDGVSMGGARSMYYGLKYPAAFKTIGSVQGAFGPFLEIYADLIARNRDALRSGNAIQLITSDKDSMAPSVERMRHLLKKEGIPHRYSILTGPHDYVFNQGPGVLALLLFHNGSLPVPQSGR